MITMMENEEFIKIKKEKEKTIFELEKKFYYIKSIIQTFKDNGVILKNFTINPYKLNINYKNKCIEFSYNLFTFNWSIFCIIDSYNVNMVDSISHQSLIDKGVFNYIDFILYNILSVRAYYKNYPDPSFFKLYKDNNILYK